MALYTLEHRDIAKIHWMLERLVGLVTRLALAIAEAAKINWMLERRDLYRSCGVRRVVDNGVTDVAIVPNNFTSITNMLAVMTAKTA